MSFNLVNFDKKKKRRSYVYALLLFLHFVIIFNICLDYVYKVLVERRYDIFKFCMYSDL